MNTDGRKARFAQAGQMIGKRLAEICTASLFSYGGQRVVIDVGDLFDEPFAVDVAELREARGRFLAIDDADREAISVGPLCGRERNSEKGVLIVFFQHDDRPRELPALAVGLVADIHAEANPPNIAVAKE